MSKGNSRFELAMRRLAPHEGIAPDDVALPSISLETSADALPGLASSVGALAGVGLAEFVDESDTVDCHRMALSLEAIAALTQMGVQCAAHAHARMTVEHADRSAHSRSLET